MILLRPNLFQNFLILFAFTLKSMNGRVNIVSLKYYLKFYETKLSSFYLADAVHYQIECDYLKSDDELCEKFNIVKAICENLNFKHRSLPDFRCNLGFTDKTIKIKYEVNCEHPYPNNKDSYIDGTCFIRYYLRKDNTSTYIVIGSWICGSLILMMICIGLIVYFRRNGFPSISFLKL